MPNNFDEANRTTLQHYVGFLKPENLSKYRWDRPEVISAKLQFRRILLQELAQARLPDAAAWQVLDLGCGSGAQLSSFLELGVPPQQLTGIDIHPQRVEEAQGLLPQAKVYGIAGDHIPEPDNRFDLALAFVVFSSMPTQALRQQMAAEMLRVVKPSGAILVHDFVATAPNSQHVRPLPTRELRELFPACHIRTRRTVLPPPISRQVAKLFPGLLPWMELALPLFSLHRLHVIRPQH